MELNLRHRLLAHRLSQGKSGRSQTRRGWSSSLPAPIMYRSTRSIEDQLKGTTSCWRVFSQLTCICGVIGTLLSKPSIWRILNIEGIFWDPARTWLYSDIGGMLRKVRKHLVLTSFGFSKRASHHWLTHRTEWRSLQSSSSLAQWPSSSSSSSLLAWSPSWPWPSSSLTSSQSSSSDRKGDCPHLGNVWWYVLAPVRCHRLVFFLSKNICVIVHMHKVTNRYFGNEDVRRTVLILMLPN